MYAAAVCDRVLSPAVEAPGRGGKPICKALCKTAAAVACPAASHERVKIMGKKELGNPAEKKEAAAAVRHNVPRMVYLMILPVLLGAAAVIVFGPMRFSVITLVYGILVLALFAVLLSVNTALIISFRKKGYKSAVIRILTVLTFAVVFAGLFVTSVWRDIKRTAIPAEGMGRLVVYEYRTGLYDAATLFYVNENGGVSMVDTNLRVLLDPDSAVPDAYCYSKGYGSVSAEDGTIYLYGVSGDGTRVREFTVNTEKYRGVFTWFEFFLLAVSASVIIPGTVFLVSACRRRKALSPPKPVKSGAEPSPAE